MYAIWHVHIAASTQPAIGKILFPEVVYKPLIGMINKTHCYGMYAGM